MRRRVRPLAFSAMAVLLLLGVGAVPTAVQSQVNGASSLYLYTVNLTTNSDWTVFNFTGGPSVLSFNATVLQGKSAPGFTYSAQPGRITVNKNGGDPTLVAMQVQVLALSGTAGGSAAISKGNIGSTNVTLEYYSAGSYHTFSNMGDSGVTGGQNTLSYSVDYSQMYANPSDSASFQPVPSSSTHKVLAFYYGWYGNPIGPSGEWYHWSGVNQTVIISATDYPLFGAYDSQDLSVIRAQILMAREAGIDGFISSWWGPETFEDHSLSVLLPVAQQLNFTVCIYYETLRPLTASQMVNELTYAVKNYGSNPAYMKVNGRPVIFIYAAWAYGRNATFWLGVRKAVEANAGPIYMIGNVPPNDASYLNVFDGYHNFVALNSTEMAENYHYWESNLTSGLAGMSWSDVINLVHKGITVPFEQKSLYYTVIPGSDRTGANRTGNGDIYYESRDGGRLYATNWQGAISNKAMNVLLVSWNEWHEGAELEPSRQYGLSYLQFTQQWTSKYKQQPTMPLGLPELVAKLTLPATNPPSRPFEANLTLTNVGSVPAVYTSLAVTAEQGLSIGSVGYRSYISYSETLNSSSYAAMIPLIMPGQSATVGLLYQLGPSAGTIGVTAGGFNAAGNATSATARMWGISSANFTATTTASTTQTVSSSQNTTTSSSASQTTSSSSSSSTAGGGIPELPYQPLAVSVLVTVVLAAYFIARRSSARKSQVMPSPAGRRWRTTSSRGLNTLPAASGQ